jgi:predicted  nucleic acid-binding Zn-ribbon protein
MSTVAQLQYDIRGLESKHDALAREIDRQHQALEQARADIRAEVARLEKIRAEIKKIKDHFGVQS